MTPEELLQFKEFEARVRRLIALHRQALGERDDLRLQNERLQQQINELQEQLQTTQQENSNLRTTRLICATQGDVKQAKQRIAHLAREVNKCITLLSTGDIPQ